MNKIPLTKLQKEIMGEFYSIPPTKVIFNKKERDKLWNAATSKSAKFNFEVLRNVCPALEHQIKKSYASGQNIQSAVFSECVYAQTFANMLKLNCFVNCLDERTGYIPNSIKDLLSSYNLVPRYVYATEDKSRMLIQAGGCGGIDSVLITVIDLVIYTIEFKEPGAKTSEPDLPKYEEDGNLVVTDDWLIKNPQFELMLEEAKGLNFFAIMGSNYHDFSQESIEYAISKNYVDSMKKFADVICTEDFSGNLVMMPANQVSEWAEIEGEIRPAGRNHYKVWTQYALQDFLIRKNAKIIGDMVSVPKSALEERRERGGNRRISGYKVTPLFFVYIKDCTENDGIISFDISKMRQLNPTIAGKMFFKGLKHSEVKEYYSL